MLFYTIMPSDNHECHKEIRRHIDSFAVLNNLTAYVPHYCKKNPTFDLDEIIRVMRSADFIVADLSLERPSSYYEVGMAEALGKKIYVLAKANTPLHQFSRRSDVAFYDDESEVPLLLQTLFLKR